MTTSSDVQAMAVDHLPGGLGTPLVVGVLLLAALVAFGATQPSVPPRAPRGRRARHAEAETIEAPIRQAVA